MDIHPLRENGRKVNVISDSRSAVRRMTSEQLLHLGMNSVAYLKVSECDGDLLVILYGADGTLIAVTEDLDAAVETAVEQGLSFVSVH